MRRALVILLIFLNVLSAIAQQPALTGRSRAARSSPRLVATNGAPVASFTATIGARTGEGIPVDFDARGSSDPDGQMLSYFWDFGDGYLGSEAVMRHVYGSPGTYTVTLTVSDGMESSDETRQVATESTNRPPVADFVFSPSQPIAGQPVAFTNHSADADDATLSYNWSFGDGATSSEANPTHTFAAKNVYNVVLTVSDGKPNGHAEKVVSVTVERGNEAPVASFTFSPSAPEAGQSITFSSTSGDGDGDPMTYVWDFGDGTTSTGKIAQKTYASAGTRTVRLTATDDRGASGSTTTSVTVRDANRPPEVDFTPTIVSSAPNRMVVQFDSSATRDPEGQPLVAYEWNFGDGAIVGSTAASPEHTYTEARNYEVTLRVSDGRSWGERTKTVIAPLNRPPTANFSVSPAQPIARETVTFTNGSSDPDGDTLSYTWSFGDGGTSTLPSPTHTYATKNMYEVVLTVSDGKANGTAQKTVNLLVERGNEPPVADFTFSPASPVVGQSITFTSTSGDGDGDALTYLWEFGDGTTSTLPTATKTYVSAWSPTVRLTVRDSFGASSSISKTFTVTEGNRPPSADFTWQVHNATQTSLPVYFDASKSFDLDGDTLTYSWTFGDSRNNTATGVQVEHVYTQPGTYRVTLTVTDNRSPVVVKAYDVPVAPPSTTNHPPDARFSWSPTEPSVGQMITFTNTSDDLDGDPLTWRWSFDDGTTSTQKNPLKAFDTAAPHRVILEVSDGRAATPSSIESTINVVQKINQFPSANFSYAPSAPAAGQAITFTDLSSDPDGDPLTYTWSFGDGTTSTLRNPSKSYSAASSYTVSLSVSDGRGGSSTLTKPITVSTTAPTGAPVLTFNRPTGTTVTSPALAITIEVSGEQLNVSTGSLRLNGVDVTASVTVTESTPTRIVGTATLQLALGSNTIVAAVSDAAGRRGEATLLVTYQKETVVAGPVLKYSRASGTTVTDPALPLTIEATGTDLVVSTGAIQLNGTAITSIFAVPVQTSTRVVADGTVQLAPGANTIVASISDAAGRRGEQTLTVTYDNAAAGLVSPTVTAPASLSLTPGAQRTVKFQVKNNSTTNRTFAFVATSSNTAAVADPADPISQLIAAGASIDVAVNVSVLSAAAAGASATIALTATDTGNAAKTASGSFVATIALVDFQLDLSPHNGENLNVAQFGATLSYTTPSYVSMDTPRALTLFYSSAQANPKGFVQVDVNDNSATPAEQYSILLRDKDGNAVTLSTGTTEAFYEGGAGISRLAAQFDAAALPTGAYAYTLVVRKWVGGNSSERTAPVRVLILNESHSPYGAGWSVAGLMRLHKQTDGLVLTAGDGTIQFFPLAACTGTTCNYNAPRGVFIQSLVERAEEPSDRFIMRSYDGSKAAFSREGVLWRMEDRFLNQIVYEYAGDELRFITDAAGKRISLNPIAGGFTISDPGTPSRVVSLTIDANHDLRSIVDPENVTALQADYVNHRVSNWSDRGGNRWDAAYDGFGSLMTTTAPAVMVREPSGVDVQVRPATTSVSLAAAVLPESGRGTSSIKPAARVIPSNVRVRFTDAKNNTTAVQIDRMGTVLREEAPLGHTTIYERDEHSRVVRTTGPSGVVVENDWDPALPLLKKVTTKIDATQQQIVNYTYEPKYLQPERIWGDGLEEVLNRYTADGRLLETRLAGDEARVTHYSFDARGRITSTSDPEGHATFYEYDANNAWMNVDAVSSGMVSAPADKRRRTTFSYDQYGRREQVTDPENHTSLTGYDAVGRTRFETDANGGRTDYVYDRLFLRSVIDAERKTHGFDYNALGWLERQVDPGQRASTYRYDRNGNVATRTNRNLQTVTFSYDAVDRVLTRTADGATTTYTYDNPAGRFVTVENPLSRETLRYNSSGDVTEQASLRNGTARYTLNSIYDPRHRREQLSMSEPFQRSIRYGYVAEKLKTLTDLEGKITSLNYNDDGQLESLTLPTVRPLTMTKAYASTHQATRVLYDDGNVDLSLGYWLTLTKRGLIESVYSATRKKVRNYGYDFAGQLRGADDADVFSVEPCPDDSAAFTHDGEPCGLPQLSQPTWSQAFSYDKVGNRTDSGAAHVDNRMTAFAGQTLGYDNEGNLTSRSTPAGLQTFTWNSLGQLATVTVPGSGTYSYGYDGLGRRIRRTEPSGSVTEYLYDGDDLFMELRNGAPLREYTYYPGIDRPHSVIQREGARAGETFYYAMEEPNNVAGLIDRNNQVVNRYVYQPFGVTQSATEGTPNPLRYLAREWDPGTSLYYVRNRWYAPELARFISEDPIGLEGGINPYAYAGNDPVNRTDPSGLDPVEGCDNGSKMIISYDAHGVITNITFICRTTDPTNPRNTHPSGRGAWPWPTLPLRYPTITPGVDFDFDYANPKQATIRATDQFERARQQEFQKYVDSRCRMYTAGWLIENIALSWGGGAPGVLLGEPPPSVVGRSRYIPGYTSPYRGFRPISAGDEMPGSTLADLTSFKAELMCRHASFNLN
ncbi:MAG: PKD domain-containing protein [Acidobacteriota bacterium]|nr:PKD domain-containing protein [Acidobacteriota bacterium]